MSITHWDEIKDTSTNKYPGYWMDSLALRNYHNNQMDQIAEYKERERIKYRDWNNLGTLHTTIHDNFFGADSRKTYEQAQLLQKLQGTWQLVDITDERTVTDITITGDVFKKNNTKEGTLTITDDMEVLLSGYFATFDPVFQVKTWGLTHTRPNGRILRVKKISN